MFDDRLMVLTPDPSGALSQPGQLLARGVSRYFAELGWASVVEFTPERGKRVDVLALGPKGEIWVVECKSSRADFTSDKKWQGYLEWADRFFWAVDEDFPTELLPLETGLIVADAYGGAIIREAPEHRLAPARRKAVTLRLARVAAERLRLLHDPATSAGT